MSLRNSAALALVGWYLMVPPIGPNRKIAVDSPLSSWRVFRSFDTAKECEGLSEKMEQMLLQSTVDLGDESVNLDALLAESGTDRESMRQLLKDHQCVASDDPRLKKK